MHRSHGHSSEYHDTESLESGPKKCDLPENISLHKPLVYYMHCYIKVASSARASGDMAALTGDVLMSVVNKTDSSHDSVVHMRSQTRGVNREFRDAVDHTEQSQAWKADICRRAEEFRCAIEPGGDVTTVEPGYENYGIEVLLRLDTYDALAVRMREFFADEITQGKILSRLSRDLQSPTPFVVTVDVLARDRRMRALRSGLVGPIAQAIRYYKNNKQIQESGLVVLQYVYSMQYKQAAPLTSLNLGLYVVNTVVVSMQNNLTNNNMLSAAASILFWVLPYYKCFHYEKETRTPEEKIRFIRCMLTAPYWASKNVLELLTVMMQHNNPAILYMDDCLFALNTGHVMAQILLDNDGVLPFNALVAMPSLLSRITRDITRPHVTRTALELIEWSFTNHFESMRVDASRICRDMVQVLVNHITPLIHDTWYYGTVILLVSKIMDQMEHILQHLPAAQWLEFQDFVYDTGIVSVYLICIGSREVSVTFQESSAAYVSVLTRLCRNNARITALVRRLQIVQTLDTNLTRMTCEDELQTNRAALNAVLEGPTLLPAPVQGAPG